MIDIIYKNIHIFFFLQVPHFVIARPGKSSSCQVTIIDMSGMLETQVRKRISRRSPGESGGSEG